MPVAQWEHGGAATQMTRWSWLAMTWSAAALAGVAVGSGCDCGMAGLPLVAARCHPNSTSEDNCPEQYVCCSDDPAQIGGVDGERLFSGENNERSHFGMCVRVSDILGQGLHQPAGCAIPCNPRWELSQIHEVCGPSRSCCQTQELHRDDCVFDEMEQRWRSADPRDALASLEEGTTWKPTTDSTHQDPDFDACERFANGDRSSDAFRECVGLLGTADQRGYCMQLGSNECPGEDDEYIDACEAMNE